MDKLAIIKIFCRLSTKIGSIILDDKLSNDCFCTEKHEPFCYHIEVIKFITDAVNEKLKRDF